MESKNYRKKLALITTFYPFGTSESFLHDEIVYLSDFFDVEIYPIIKSKKGDAPRKLPSNVKFKEPFLNRNYLLRFLKGLFNLSPFIIYLKDLKLLFKNSKKIKESLIQWMFHFITYRTIFSSKDFKAIFNSKIDIVYIYWGIFPARLIKRNNKNIFIRIHGGEVDLNRNGGYLPLLKENIINDNLVCYLPISNIASNNMLSMEKVNYKISRLGVSINEINKNLIDNDRSPIRIVSCSNMIPLKRIHLIIEALHVIDDLEIEWIHFGDGYLMNELESIAKNKLGKNIKYNFMGFVKNKKILDFYKNSHIDLFINTSEFEGIPVTLMEAMSYGILCFATSVGAVSEILSNETGILVSSDFKINILTDSIRNSRNKEMINKRSLARNKCDSLYNADKNYKELTKFMLNY